MEYLAAVLVGKSRRLPGKHLRIVYDGKRLIDMVVENLTSMGFKVIIYSTYHFDAPAPLILDTSTWIFPAVVNLLKKFGEPMFIFGGDMPLVEKKAVEMMMKHTDHRIVVPRWRNGYLEPLHAYYTPHVLPVFEGELQRGGASLHSAIQKCRDTYYMSAEEMGERTFFNVNTLEDLHILKKWMDEEKP